MKSSATKAFLKDEEWQEMTLIDKQQLTPDVFLFRFEFQDDMVFVSQIAHCPLWLSIMPPLSLLTALVPKLCQGLTHAGQHCLLRLFQNEDMEIVRPYTPISPFQEVRAR